MVNCTGSAIVINIRWSKEDYGGGEKIINSVLQ